MATGTFSIDVSRWTAKAKGREDLVVRKIALTLFSRVIMRSPVDTGRFRGNWQVAIGNVPAGTLDLTDKTGTATLNAAQAVTLNLKAGDQIFLVNNLPYGPALERGHSKQAPAGMVAVTVSEFQQVTREAAEAAKRERP